MNINAWIDKTIFFLCRIENGFFGIANEENNVDQLTKPLTDKNDDLKMDTEDETAINQL